MRQAHVPSRSRCLAPLHAPGRTCMHICTHMWLMCIHSWGIRVGFLSFHSSIAIVLKLWNDRRTLSKILFSWKYYFDGYWLWLCHRLHNSFSLLERLYRGRNFVPKVQDILHWRKHLKRRRNKHFSTRKSGTCAPRMKPCACSNQAHGGGLDVRHMRLRDAMCAPRMLSCWKVTILWRFCPLSPQF